MEVAFMATKSILKDIYIRDRKTMRSLLSALTNAKNKSSKPVVLRRGLEEVKSEDISKYFEEN
jgi:hypothetical protein